ncbi:MAG: Uma2 family endonuclease [Cyanophyceae cyanobacterium]
MVNIASRLTQSPQPFVLPGRYSWSDFQTLDSIIRQDSKLHITYLDGVIELMPLGEEHESISRMLGILIALYLVKENIDFTVVGSATRASEEKSVSFEPDESYYLGEKKEHPDLAIEVNITSGGPKKLEKYKRLEIQEVWMWSNKKITIFTLENERYSAITRSQLLPDLDIKRLESSTLLTSQREAINQFTTDQ